MKLTQVKRAWMLKKAFEYHKQMQNGIAAETQEKYQYYGVEVSWAAVDDLDEGGGEYSSSFIVPTDIGREIIQFAEQRISEELATLGVEIEDGED